MNDIPFSRVCGEATVSTDRARIDVDLVHRVLSSTYWAAGIPRDIVVASIKNSLAFGMYEGVRQVGFARVVTDLATFGYLADVFVVEGRRGHGLGGRLVESILLHPQLRGLRRLALITRDAGALYARHGFAAQDAPVGYMDIVNRDVYRTRAPESAESER